MPNDIANNMADTIHQLEEDRIMLNTQLTDLQLAYNEQMLELKEAKRLLKAAVEDIHKTYHHRDECCDICKNKQTCTINCAFVWQHEAEALALIGGEADD